VFPRLREYGLNGLRLNVTILYYLPLNDNNGQNLDGLRHNTLGPVITDPSNLGIVFLYVRRPYWLNTNITHFTHVIQYRPSLFADSYNEDAAVIIVKYRTLKRRYIERVHHYKIPALLCIGTHAYIHFCCRPIS